MRFIVIFSGLLIGANRCVLSRDGLHLSYEGTDALLNNLQRAVNGQNTSRETNVQIPSTLINSNARRVKNVTVLTHKKHSA